MSERLDRIETEIERILGIQRELQESQLRLLETTNRNAEAIAQNSEAIGRLERSVEGLVRVATVQQDSLEEITRKVDRLSDQGDGANGGET